jgi:hypothetical protein
MWLKIRAWFHDSEVIFWGRLQVVAGAIGLFGSITFEVISHTDLSVFISNPKILSAVGISNGLITEYLRRRRATDLGPPTDKISTE